jgi:GNAT superfamily N-acetyltransferase
MINETPLAHATDAELIPASMANLYTLFRAMARSLPGSELEEGERLSRHLTFPSNPMFKGVWATRLAAAEVDAALDETIAWFKARGAPFFFWWTGPEAQPHDLGQRLEGRGLLSMEQMTETLAHGMVQTVAGAPIMATDLAQVDDSLMTRTPPGFAIEEVGDEVGLREWKRVVVETYELPAWAGQAWVDASLRLGIGQTPWRMYLGRLGGEAVASSMLFTGGGVASILAVATLPKAQRKGIGAAISLKPLLEARAEGYRYATLWSTEEGAPVYRRIGFHDTGARLNRYLWRNPD